jgi:HEAT repeat protein
MKRLAGFLIVLAGLAGMAAAQDLEYFQSALRSDNLEAKRSVLLQITNIHNEAASRVALLALSDRNELVRATAASAVISLPPAEAARALMPLLNDKAAFVRTEAAYALGKAGDNSAVNSLTTTLQNDSAKEARAAAAISLGLIGDTAAVKALSAVFKKSPSEDNEFIRRSAARSIGQIAQAARQKGSSLDPQTFRPAVPVLIKALNNSKETSDTRRESAAALGWIGDPAAAGALRSQLSSADYYLADMSRQALARIEGQK